VLLAMGDEKLVYHGPDRASSKTAAFLTSVGLVGAGSEQNLLLKLHGIFMILAWMGCAGTAIIMARYFKDTWKGHQILGKDRWFQAHRTLMTITVLLTIVGLVLAFVHTGGWQYDSTFISNYPHPVLGLVTAILAFIQPIMAFFRPHPQTEWRVWFNWAHFLVGNAAMTLAFASIILAASLKSIPVSVTGFLACIAVYIAVYVIAHLVLTGSSMYYCREEATEVHPMSEKGSMSEAAVPVDKPGGRLRKYTLLLFTLVSIASTVALVVLVATAQK